MSVNNIQGQSLPDSDHVARYIPFSKLRNDGYPDREAFKIYPKDQGYLSVDWLEYYEPETEKDNRLPSLLKSLSKVFNPKGRLTITENNKGKFAIFCVSNVKEIIEEVSSLTANDINICQIINSKGKSDSHSGVFYPENPDEIAEALQKSSFSLESVSKNFPK